MRFLVFGYHSHEQHGPANELIGTRDTIEECRQLLDRTCRRGNFLQDNDIIDLKSHCYFSFKYDNGNWKLKVVEKLDLL